MAKQKREFYDTKSIEKLDLNEINQAGTVRAQQSGPAPHCGFVALIGRPNVGKSTLMNRVIGQKIAITSPKAQTTRNRIQTVYTDARGQIIFLDTPGLHKAHNKLGTYMVSVAENAMKDVDLVLWLIDPQTGMGEEELQITEKLKKAGSPVMLVINKSDTVKKEELLPVLAEFSKVLDFVEMIPVSALRNQHMGDLVEAIFKYLPEGPAFYDEDTLTDQPMRAIVAEMIREKALRNLGDEIPHGIAVGIESMKRRGKLYDIEATIYCEKDSHKGMIIGKGGSKLKEIGSYARPEIEELLESQVNLQLWVKVKKDWRDSDLMLKNFGYFEDNS